MGNKINICCLSCRTHIAFEFNKIIIIDDVRVISSVEVSELITEIKCRACSNWNSFGPEGQTINYKRKGSEALHNSLKK